MTASQLARQRVCPPAPGPPGPGSARPLPPPPTLPTHASRPWRHRHQRKHGYTARARPLSEHAGILPLLCVFTGGRAVSSCQRRDASLTQQLSLIPFLGVHSPSTRVHTKHQEPHLTLPCHQEGEGSPRRGRPGLITSHIIWNDESRRPEPKWAHASPPPFPRAAHPPARHVTLATHTLVRRAILASATRLPTTACRTCTRSRQLDGDSCPGGAGAGTSSREAPRAPSSPSIAQAHM